MKRVFADSYYWIAALNPSDAHHERAIRLGANLSHPLVTTQWVLVETADALSAPGYRSVIAEFLSEITANRDIEVIAASSS
jgi:predicted nucleic acid-binding protein